jgi:hypothetical protein
VGNRLHPFTQHGWVDGALSLGSLVLVVVGGVLTLRAYLYSPGAAADYLPGVGGLAAGVLGLAVAEVLSVLHQLYRRLAEVETSVRERVAEAEARVLARPPAPPGSEPSGRGAAGEPTS